MVYFFRQRRTLMKNMRIRIGGACSPAEESVITQREMEAIKWAAEIAYGEIRDQYICDESDVFAGYMDAAVFMAQHDAAKACSFICTLLRSTLSFEVEDLVSKLTCEDDGSMEAFVSAFVDEIWQDLFFSEEEEYNEDTDDDSCGKIRISVEGESCDDLKDVFDDILKAFGFHIPDEDWGCEHCE